MRRSHRPCVQALPIPTAVPCLLCPYASYRPHPHPQAPNNEGEEEKGGEGPWILWLKGMSVSTVQPRSQHRPSTSRGFLAAAPHPRPATPAPAGVPCPPSLGPARSSETPAAPAAGSPHPPAPTPAPFAVPSGPHGHTCLPSVPGPGRGTGAIAGGGAYRGLSRSPVGTRLFFNDQVSSPHSEGVCPPRAPAGGAGRTRLKRELERENKTPAVSSSQPGRHKGSARGGGGAGRTAARGEAALQSAPLPRRSRQPPAGPPAPGTAGGHTRAPGPAAFAARGRRSRSGHPSSSRGGGGGSQPCGDPGRRSRARGGRGGGRRPGSPRGTCRASPGAELRPGSGVLSARAQRCPGRRVREPRPLPGGAEQLAVSPRETPCGGSRRLRVTLRADTRVPVHKAVQRSW